MRSLFKRASVPFQRCLLAALVVLLATGFLPRTVISQNAPDPISDHVYAFAQHVTITLTLTPDAEADVVTLFLRTGRTETKLHIVVPDGQQAQYQRDLRKDPLPPFTEITYWWQYEGASGETLTTPATSFLYEDNRFAWETLSEPDGEISLYWVAGSTELMTTGLDIARTTLDKLKAQLDAEATDMRIYIYPSRPNLEQALRLAGLHWVVGEAHPEVGVGLVAIPPDDRAISRMKTLLPHEITHLVLYRHLGAEGYANLPTWLNEGLASYFEQRPDPAYTLALEEAEANHDWISLERLCEPFYEMTGDRTTLAYAESQSLTRYLIEAYGWRRTNDLLAAYADGLNCTRGLERALDVDLLAFEREWKVWLRQDGQTTPSQQRVWAMVLLTLRDIAPWLLLALFLLVPSVLVVLASRSPHAVS